MFLIKCIDYYMKKQQNYNRRIKHPQAEADREEENLMKREKNLRTLIITRSVIKGAFGAVCGVLILSITATVLTTAVQKDSGFMNSIIDRYFGRNKVYAEVSEIISDPEGRVSAILDSYTIALYEKGKATPTPSPVPSTSPEAVLNTEPQKQTTPKIVERTATAVSEIKNLSGKSIDAEKIAKEPLGYKISSTSPQVLIVHTHTTESYHEQDRSVDEEKNMTAVGKVMAKKLSESGILCVHDTTVHDYPSYNGAYTLSAATTKAQLAANPSIKIVLDVHRDAVSSEDGSKLKLSTNINGESVAQIMFVVGTDAQLKHNNWKENMKLALKLQRKANEMYPTLMRPINLRAQRFNQQLSKGSIIIEVGTNGNTIEEAKRGAELISDVIVSVLNEYKE